MPHNCSGPRSAVQRCRSALNEVQAKIDQNKEYLVSHPNDINVQHRLQELLALYEVKKAEMDDAETALAECEAQNENQGSCN